MPDNPAWFLPNERYFDPDPAQRRIAMELYDHIADAPIVSPHGHVDPQIFLEGGPALGSPVDLFIIPDHYVYRMLYSQGIPLEALGIPRIDGGPVEGDHRKIWQTFADHFFLFRGTPTGGWLAYELDFILGVKEKLTPANAQAVYDQIAARLASPDFQPRAVYERFNIATLCTTDPAWDCLPHHQALRASNWQADIRPTFRPDGVLNLDSRGWRENLTALSQASGIQIGSYPHFIQALEAQRARFRRLGAAATDHAALTAFTGELTAGEAEAIFQRALRGAAQPGDAQLFTGHMLMEMARMSVEDGLVMQLHTGSLRNHNQAIFDRFGSDKGADIPVPVEYTLGLRPLLNRFGSHPAFTLILFTLDETAYSRELAPLAGHYPAVKLGPPWWFYDSLNGMRRYFDLVMETAGLFNTAEFNDDTRAFLSIPARHDLWRRVGADWLAGLVVRGILDEVEAAEMAMDLAIGLARRAYHL